MSDSKLVDFQAGMESAMGATLAAVSGINNVSGPGMHDFEACQSLEKLVLDHEICGLVLRLAAGIELRDDPIALPVLEEGLVTKEFLSLDHTAKWFRQEGYYPSDVIDRATLGEWEAAGGKDAATRASERVRSILSQHEPQPLEAPVATYLSEIMQREAREAGLDGLPELKLAEDPERPLSDQEIFRRLKAEGIILARRTVTKYREELKILPARFRKPKARASQARS